MIIDASEISGKRITPYACLGESASARKLDIFPAEDGNRKHGLLAFGWAQVRGQQ
jgi:hypothetical protein